jgi:hypothetical protein
VREAAHDPSGHRARLRKRLLSGSDDALADHEVIEALLMTVIPRMDVKPLARMLLQRFGSLPGVFNADPRALQRCPASRRPPPPRCASPGSPRAAGPRKCRKCPCCRAGRR